jgi:hypothetical protein
VPLRLVAVERLGIVEQHTELGRLDDVERRDLLLGLVVKIDLAVARHDLRGVLPLVGGRTLHDGHVVEPDRLAGPAPSSPYHRTSPSTLPRAAV